MQKTIGIIGGKGKMGRAFATFFQKNGFDVLISDKGTKLTNKKIVQKSDIIFLSVSIVHTEKVLKEIIPYIKKNQALIEITSVKDPLVPLLNQVKGEVLSLHPMCNHTQLTEGARILFMPLKGKRTAKILKKLFEEAHFIVQEVSIKKHDMLMSLIQGLPHFAEIVFAHTMQNLGFKTKQLSAYASPATDLKLKMVGRILAQDPDLYGGIQIYNPRNKKMLKAHLESANELYEIVQKNDMKAFRKYFQSSAKFLGKYKDAALSETDHVIGVLREENLIESEKGSKKPKKTRKISPKKTLALLGPKYTYTDFAADLFLKHSQTKSSNLTKPVIHKSYKNTIEEVFEDVEKGRAAIGLLPIENKLHGTVRETLDGLFSHNVEVIKSIKLPINHCISMLPGVKQQNIKIIMSHSQALSQCKKYLKKHFKNADHVAVSSSAKAFETVKNKNFRHIAVIGPETSALHYGLKVIAKNIADEKDNFTKFIAINKAATKSTKLSTNHTNPLLKNPKHTSIAFYFSKDQAGSLFTVFQAFAENQVNMTKVESRPYKEDFGNYIFFIDFEGNTSQNKVLKTLKRVATITAGLKILGTY